MDTTGRLFDFEFTLALNNRTGKYYYCQELLEASDDLINTCVYWRWRSRGLPTGTPRRVLGRVARWEVELRTSWSGPTGVPRPSGRRRRPIVFCDPREVVLHRLEPTDVVICHDLGPLTHGQLYSPGVTRIYERAFDAIAAARPFLVFLTQSARAEFVSFFGDDFPLMQIVSPPIRAGQAGGELRRPAGVPDRFLLTVGAVGERKNQLGSLRAFHRAGLAAEGYAYVICGGLTEPGADAVVDEAKVTPGVLLTGYADDAELRWLYRNARGFVLPSLLEGFGLPAAEAIHHGALPLLAGGGALAEVAGQGAIYVDPGDVDEIAAGLRLMATMSDDERERRLARMRDHIGRFSAEKELDKWRRTLLLAGEAWSRRR